MDKARKSAQEGAGGNENGQGSEASPAGVEVAKILESQKLTLC